MRTIIIVLFLVLFYIFSLPMYLVGYLLGIKDEDRKHRFSQALVAWAFRVVLFLSGVKLTVKGKENMPKDTAAMYAFNHRGFFDIIAGYATAPKLSLFISKNEIEHVPLLARWMRYMHCLFLDRNDIKKGMQTILTGIELLKTGHNVYVAPEGTRNHGEELLEFHEATFKLADKSKCPIVPVALNNTDSVLEKHMPWVHKAHVIIEYCEPIYMDKMEKADKKHVGAMVREIIASKVKENEKEL